MGCLLGALALVLTNLADFDNRCSHIRRRHASEIPKLRVATIPGDHVRYDGPECSHSRLAWPEAVRAGADGEADRSHVACEHGHLIYYGSCYLCSKSSWWHADEMMMYICMLTVHEVSCTRTLESWQIRSVWELSPDLSCAGRASSRCSSGWFTEGI